tara:strand:- start:288 stop:638 length:351 start_codon:yes stop_codon:yes gene_type:complete
MANAFQTKTLKVTTTLTDLVPVYTTGQVVVHAVFISNRTTSDVKVDMGVYDGAGVLDANRQSWILYQTIVPPESTLTIEKPINLESSATDTEQRRVMAKASGNSAIEILASVLVIT